MKGKESINEFTTKITKLANQVKTCEDTITKQYMVDEILRFDNIMVAIEESMDL